MSRLGGHDKRVQINNDQARRTMTTVCRPLLLSDFRPILPTATIRDQRHVSSTLLHVYAQKKDITLLNRGSCIWQLATAQQP
jgi:hypothetical protein